jgi:hypothetical protein
MHCYRYTILLATLPYTGKVTLISREIEPRKSSSASKLLSLEESGSSKVADNAERRIPRLKRVYRPESAFSLNYRHWIKLDEECQDHLLGR